MSDHVDLVMRLGALASAAQATGDDAAATTLRDAVAKIMEAHSLLADTERRRKRDRDRKKPSPQLQLSEDSSDSVETVGQGARSSVDSSDSVESVSVQTVRGARSVESKDSAETPSPLSSLLPPTPPNNSSLPSPRSTSLPTPARSSGRYRDSLAVQCPAEPMADIDEFVDGRPSDQRERWYREILRIAGPATGVAWEDMGSACRHALIADPPVTSPAGLIAFAERSKEKRVRTPAANGSRPHRGAQAQPAPVYDPSSNDAAARRLEKELGPDDRNDDRS